MKGQVGFCLVWCMIILGAMKDLWWRKDIVSLEPCALRPQYHVGFLIESCPNLVKVEVYFDEFVQICWAIPMT